MVALIEVTNNLESIGDIVETNVISFGFSRLDQELVVSDATRKVLEEFESAVEEAFDLAMAAVTQKDHAAARRVRVMKSEINSMEHAASLHQAQRLTADEPKRIENYRLEIDVIANLKRIYYFSKRIARMAIPADAREPL